MANSTLSRTPTQTLTQEELEIFKKCSTDILEFIKYVKIFNPAPGKGWLTFGDVAYPKQKKILKDLQDNWKKKFIVLLSPRQSSKTTLVLVFILWIITFTVSSNIGIVANKKDNARKIFRRFNGMYERLPQMFRLSSSASDSKFEMELSDGTIVFCAATSKSGLRSESLTILYWDEAAWIQTEELQQEFFTSNYPIMESMSGGLIVSSTPNGKDLFYDLYCKTQRELKGEPNPKYDPKWVLEQIHWKDVDPRGIGRDDKWREQKIRDLGVGGQNGFERFAQEYDNSFEIQAGVARFFNQDVVASLHPRTPLYEWVPDKDYIGEPIKIYDRIADQTFLIGVDLAEGKYQNFSTVIGLSVRKQKISGDTGLETYYADQAFQFMHAGILPDDLFDLLFNFITTQLNDKWYLIFELNDVGRLFSVRFENLLGEITSGEFSKKNEMFKQLLTDKFSGDNDMMLSYYTRRTYRSLGGAKKRGFIPWGFKSDRKNSVELKANLKSVIDKRTVSVCDEYLLEEMRLFEDRRGKEAINHQGYEGISHFDIVTALKFATWMMSDRSRMKDVMSITPLMDNTYSRERQFLDAVLGANAIRTPRQSLRKQMERENMEQLMSKGEVPLKYDQMGVQDLGDVTSSWQHFGKLFRKK